MRVQTNKKLQNNTKTHNSSHLWSQRRSKNHKMFYDKS